MTAVVAACPLCIWDSGPFLLDDGPNAEWHARQPAAALYRRHYTDAHMTAPTFVLVDS